MQQPPQTWTASTRPRPDYAADRELAESCLMPKRPFRADDSADREAARTILNDFQTAWDIRLRHAWSRLRGTAPFDAVRGTVLRQSRRYVQRYYPEVYQVQLRARLDGGLAGNFQFARLWEIAELVRFFRIKSCLELGSGASSAMFASVLDGPQSFETVEEHPQWRDRLLVMLGDLQNRCTSITAATVVECCGDLPTIHYAIDHSRTFDMVYVDGPTNTPQRRPEGLEAAYRFDPHAGQLPCIDVARMWENGVYPRLIAVDGRRSTIRFLLERCGDRYDFILNAKYHAQFYGTMPPAYLYHSLFVRRDAMRSHPAAQNA